MMFENGLICHVCGEVAAPAKIRLDAQTIDGWRCACGEEYLHPGQAQRLLFLNKIKNTKYSVKLGQMRSNLFLRIPTEVAQALELKKGKRVELTVGNDGEIRIRG